MPSPSTAPRPGDPARPGGRRGRDRPGACALVWDDMAQAAWGSATRARFWVALEQTGPWGRDAFVESRLDADLGRRIEGGCFRAGGRALLIRVVGPEQDVRAGFPGRPRRVFVSGGMPTRPWLLAGFVEDPADVLDIPFDAVAAGDVDAVLDAASWLRRHVDPVALVCTNSKRDVCCAVRGRPVAVGAATSRPGQVWECSHTGGHRFAPTGVLLPHGVTYARCDAETIVAALDAARAEMVPRALADRRHLRGLSHLWPAEQAADAFVRSAHDVLGVGDLRLEQVSSTPLAPSQVRRPVDGTPPRWTFDVTHVDGRSWRVDVCDETSGELAVTSCGAGPVPVHSFTARFV